MDAVAASPSGELMVNRLPAVPEIVPITCRAGAEVLLGSSIKTDSKLRDAGVLTEERARRSANPLRISGSAFQVSGYSDRF